MFHFPTSGTLSGGKKKNLHPNQTGGTEHTHTHTHTQINAAASPIRAPRCRSYLFSPYSELRPFSSQPQSKAGGRKSNRHHQRVGLGGCWILHQPTNQPTSQGESSAGLPPTRSQGEEEEQERDSFMEFVDSAMRVTWSGIIY